MTLEFENPPLLSNIGLNSSYNNETDFTALDRVTSKKTSIISVTRKESFFAKEKRQENREMSGRYSDDYDSYEDDFDSPSPTKEPTRRLSSRRGSERVRSTSRSPSDSPPKHRSRLSKKASSRRDSFASYRSAYGTNRGPAKHKTKKSQSASSKMTTKTSGTGESSMMRRVLSANRNKVSRLHNIMEELQQEVEELKDENKSLKRVSHRQDKQIKKIDEEEASLPMLLQRHSAEMRTLKERLRRNQDILHKKEKESSDRDHEIQKLRDKVSSYRELSEDRKLEQRAALAKKLDNIQDEMSAKDKKIMELEKTITLKDKARQRDMKDQKERYKQAKEELKRVQEDFRSLRERLKEKERELDEKNIYHQHITKQKKKGTTLPALPAGSAATHAPTIAAPAVHIEKAPDAKEKRTNVFLTNAPSDSGSAITDEGKSLGEKSEQSSVRPEQPAASESARPGAGYQPDQRDDDDELRRREAEERRRREEDGRRRRIEEEEERKRKEEEEETRRRQEERDRRKREEEEVLRKQREEQERLRTQREEEEKIRLEEDAETRRKKDLLLARMRAIDGRSDKPNGVIITGGAVPHPAEDKPKKVPIFLQSDKPIKTEPPQPKPTNATTSDDDIFSDASGGRKKFSASSKQSRNSYDFKQTVENLHHGLPAHASEDSIQNEVTPKPDVKDSLSDDLSFGSYKPTLGRRAAAKRDNKEKDDLSFGSYNPSFAAQKDTTRKTSGLDFGAGKKNSSEKEQNGVIFGDYNPTFGGVSSKTASSQPNGDIVGGRTSPARGRRAKGFAGKGNSLFGDDLFTNEGAVKPTGNPLFGDSSSINKDKSSYPWENKVNVARRSSQTQSQEDSLLPRRKRIQSIGKSAETNVRAVDNALDDVDDELEEVIL